MVLHDVRGYTEDENKYFGDQKGITKSERINEELFHAPIFFNFVSERLHTLYENKYQVEIVNYSICASAYNDTIFKPNLTKDIDASEKLKVVFVGGSQAYQKIESLVELLEEQSNVEFTVVTNKKVNIPKAKTTRFLSGLTPKEVSKLRSEEHTSELQSRGHLVCRLLLEKKKNSEQTDQINGV